MTKYVNNNGVSEMWTNTKNYVSAQLLGYSQTGHTHSASDITSGLSTVATSGSYNDLSNKPTIPSKTSDLTNDSGFITSDNTKIPLAGSNQISGDLVPATDNAYDLGSATYGFANIFTKYVQGSNTQKELSLFSSNNTYDPWNHGACISLYTNDYSGDSARIGTFSIRAQGSGNNRCNLIGTPSGTLMWGSKNVAMQEDVIPRSGGAVMTGSTLSRNVDNDGLIIRGGAGYGTGAQINLYGANRPSEKGSVYVQPNNSTDSKTMIFAPNGTWTWQGQAVQLVSDQRFKQQITEIDDKLLDAWEDVNLVQFKYNDAIKEKSDNARLHTGYVVQQIDEACKSHGVDISKYGLYCHEEYAEETREVEHEDGTKTIEVVRPANEHYSLRYTEALIVECAYLRKKLKELTARIEELEKGNNVK